MEIQWDILEPVQNGDVDSSSDSDNDPILTTSSRYKPEKQGNFYLSPKFLKLFFFKLTKVKLMEEIILKFL